MIAWNNMPATAQASTNWAMLNAVLSACVLPTMSPMSEATACAPIAGNGPNARKMANEKVAEATTS